MGRRRGERVITCVVVAYVRTAALGGRRSPLVSGGGQSSTYTDHSRGGGPGLSRLRQGHTICATKRARIEPAPNESRIYARGLAPG